MSICLHLVETTSGSNTFEKHYLWFLCVPLYSGVPTVLYTEYVIETLGGGEGDKAQFCSRFIVKGGGAEVENKLKVDTKTISEYLITHKKITNNLRFII